MNRNTGLFIIWSLILAGPIIAIAIPIIRYEPGLRLLGEKYVILFFSLAGIAACAYLLSARAVRALNIGWRMRFSAIPWLVISVGALLPANFDLHEPRFRSSHAFFHPPVEVFVYERTCFPPDSRTECRDYANYIYLRRNYLSPLLVLKKRVGHVVHKVEMKNRNTILLRAPGGSAGTEINLR